MLRVIGCAMRLALGPTFASGGTLGISSGGEVEAVRGEVQDVGRVELREVGLGGGETAEDLRVDVVARGLGLEERGFALGAGQRREACRRHEWRANGTGALPGRCA